MCVNISAKFIPAAYVSTIALQGKAKTDTWLEIWNIYEVYQYTLEDCNALTYVCQNLQNSTNVFQLYTYRKV